jgi:hypothetical protein
VTTRASARHKFELRCDRSGNGAGRRREGREAAPCDRKDFRPRSNFPISPTPSIYFRERAAHCEPRSSGAGRKLSGRLRACSGR